MRKERWAKSSGSTIGRGWVRLRAIIAPSRAVPTAKEASVGRAAQPQSLPSTMPSVIRASASASISAPGRSGRRLSRSGRSGRRLRPASRIAAPSGRLTRKTRRQSLSSTSAPPRVGPVAAAAAAAAPQRPTPVERFSTGKLSRTIASEAGAISAAPTPCRTRKAISSSSAGSDRAEQAGDGEAGDPEQEDALVAEAVGEPTRRDQQRCDHDEVAVEHPGERVAPRAGEGGRDVGEGDVDDRRVEEGDESARRRRSPQSLL